MNNYFYSVSSKQDLKKTWQESFLTGFQFIQTKTPFPSNTYFHLHLRVENNNAILKLPCRVIQILNENNPATKGMVIEFSDFDLYKEKIQSFLQDETQAQTDFSKLGGRKPQDFQNAAPYFQSLQDFLQKRDQSNYYEILDVKPSTSTKKIEEAYLSMVRKLHPDQFSFRPPKELITMLDEALLHLKYIYQTLNNKKKRIKYDLSQNLIIRWHDESKADFEIRKIQFSMNSKRKKLKEVQTKAERIFQEGLNAESEGNFPAALKHIKIALKFDTTNKTYRKKVKELEQKIPKETLLGQKKLEDLLLGQERSAARDKIDWSE